MINKAFERLGYKVEEDNEHIVVYEKREPQGFIHVIALCNKKHSKPIIQSYDKHCIKHDGEWMNCMCGMTLKETMLASLKLISKGW